MALGWSRQQQWLCRVWSKIQMMCEKCNVSLEMDKEYWYCPKCRRADV
jgi:Zn finger protein HypA/HybF involved in hydrogenase expression